MRKKIYVSGPMTGSGVMAENVAKGIEAGRKLIELGFAPYVPQLTHYLDPDNTIAHHVWMDVDLPWVQMADGVLRLPGVSSGADTEVRHARACRIPIFESIEELASYFGAQG